MTAPNSWCPNTAITKSGRAPKKRSNSAAPAPVIPCASAASTAVAGRPGPRRATTPLPSPIPNRKTSRTRVNAYVEPPTTITSTRVHAISSSSDANAVSPRSVSAT